ncbi:MAG: DUF1622 domain-containing protein [Bacteroidia bacterium]
MEELARQITFSISTCVDIIAAIIIGIASLKVVFKYFSNHFLKAKEEISNAIIRIQLGGSIAVALEFLLGADVLRTAVAPTWNDIGQLAAIAVLRTGLNYFLERELKSSEVK